jgi:putative restriction endonuclease
LVHVPASARAGLEDDGAPFLFKLHAPKNFVVGGGFYVRYSALPARLAWDAFGEKNGVSSYGELRSRVAQYRSSAVVGDPEIGCHVLNRPFLWNEEDWVPVPGDWSRNIVQGRSYASDTDEGLFLWNAVMDRLSGERAGTSQAQDGPRYGADYLTQARLGQGAFRVLVTDAYQRRCAVTSERTLPVLEAAHIKPYAENGAHLVSNGLLLRSDLHTLFDRGYLTVTPDMRVEVSRRIKEEFSNGREYYKFHGQPLLVLPTLSHELPAADLLRWHNETKFLG